jgi:phage terminase large subunit GpA-like protein
MILKAYKADGSPDFRKWAVECNRCHARRDLSGSETWLIPIDEEMADYCPACEYVTARQLLRAATKPTARFPLLKFMARRRARKAT